MRLRIIHVSQTFRTNLLVVSPVSWWKKSLLAKHCQCTNSLRVASSKTRMAGTRRLVDAKVNFEPESYDNPHKCKASSQVLLYFIIIFVSTVFLISLNTIQVLQVEAKKHSARETWRLELPDHTYH